MSTGVFYLVYTSIASKLMSDESLLRLLDQSRSNNNLVGLTGMLLYMEGKFITKTQGRFIQVLEGEKEQVLLLYNNICQDERNCSVLMLGSGFNNHRCFPAWAMGFRSLDIGVNDIEGFLNLEGGLPGIECKQESDGITDLLRSFYLINTER